jgi:hypothetical protein
MVTPAQVDACGTALMTAPCNDVFSFLLSGQTPPACNYAPGSVANGAACASSEQCQSLHCQLVLGTGCGTCAPSVMLGGACVTSGDCPFESACVGAVCVSLGAAGATCDATHPCNLGLLCSGGMCAAPLAEGATCTTTGQDPCDVLQGEFCNPKTLVCQKVKYGQAGQQCGIVGTDLVQCAGAGLCSGLSKMSFTGMCVAAAADGAACDAKAGPYCMAPALCIGGTCQSSFSCP